MIPKIIWQTHELPYNQLPDFQKDIISTWKYLNPGWQHIYVSAEERSKQVKEYDDFLYTCYSLLEKIHQSDIWRLVALYEHGGFYSDMDSICIKPIEEIKGLNYEGIEMVCSPIGFQHVGVNGSNFGSIKNSKIVKLILDAYISEYKEYGMEKLPQLERGIPENMLFSEKIQENEQFIYFNNEYFNHTEEYKTSFDINDIRIHNFDSTNMINSLKNRNDTL
jgi:hypothetical protein